MEHSGITVLIVHSSATHSLDIVHGLSRLTLPYVGIFMRSPINIYIRIVMSESTISFVINFFLVCLKFYLTLISYSNQYRPQISGIFPIIYIFFGRVEFFAFIQSDHSPVLIVSTVQYGL